MAYRYLRALMKRKSPPEDYTLKNCKLIIDGRSFFKPTYKKSDCQSILGGEYDRYAHYLKSILKPFKKCNVTCYVIFNGSMEADLERRTELHKEVVNHANNIDPEDRNAYCEPILAKDVWKEVLDELEIKYYVTEHDSWKVIFYVASAFHCPILTNNYEYSLRYMDCISPKSLVYHNGSDEIFCKIFNSENVRNIFSVKHTVIPLFLTLLDESSTYYKKLSEIVDCVKPKDILPKVLRWTRWQAYDLENTLLKIQEILSEEECEDFFKAYDNKKDLCKKQRHQAAVYHFRHGNTNGNNKIPIPYTNLISNEMFSGSWAIYDEDQPDAMLASMDIVFYVYNTLKCRKDDNIIFIGRQKDETCVWKIKTKQLKFSFKNQDPFIEFTYKTMPGFDFENLKTVPEECWILIVTLVYYLRNRTDLNFAYSMIMSYVFMGPVSENTGLIKRSKFISPETVANDDIEDKNGLKNKECVAVIDSLMDLFYVKNLKQCFDKKILHTFAEFQHCLQHMNYLNRLCGQKIKTTVYHKTINATFAYNIYLKLKDKSDAHKYLKKRLKNSSVFAFYTKIKNVFDACLLSIGKGALEK